MKRKTFCASVSAALATCGGGSAATSFAVLGRDAEPFRSAFNRARNAVRVVLLVSPT